MMIIAFLLSSLTIVIISMTSIFVNRLLRGTIDHSLKTLEEQSKTIQVQKKLLDEQSALIERLLKDLEESRHLAEIAIQQRDQLLQ